MTARAAPSVIACGTALKLGVSARDHRGSRRVRVRIYTGTRLVYNRTVVAPKRWNKRLACGRSYRVVYRLPSGREITRRTRVVAVRDSLPGPSETTSGSDQSPPTPDEQTVFTQMDAQDACDAVDEAHEDDDSYEPPPCPGGDDPADPASGE